MNRTSVLVFITLMTTANQDCKYTTWLDVFNCYGVNITQLTDLGSVCTYNGSRCILETIISDLPQFDAYNWTSLRAVDNVHLPCEIVTSLRQNDTQLIVTSDCNRLQYSDVSEIKKKYDLDNLAYLTVLAPLSMIIIVIRKRLNKSRKPERSEATETV